MTVESSQPPVSGGASRSQKQQSVAAKQSDKQAGAVNFTLLQSALASSCHSHTLQPDNNVETFTFDREQFVKIGWSTATPFSQEGERGVWHPQR